MFVDKVTVTVAAGKGGNGAVSFRHEKYIDKGGPDGGDGGNGGDVVAVGSTRTNTLAAYRHLKEMIAKDGSPGSKRKKHGKSAPNLQLVVPVGTSIYNPAGELLVDIVADNQTAIIAKGGKGGFGNAHFTSSRRQTPRVAEKGEPGESFEARLELKLIAQVGLIGLPNAGKSTLLSRISNAKPEIADYPFTTIKPNLGVAKVSDERSLLVADIPGLIEGASAGKGLGDDFLRHVERTKVLVHLIDVYSSDVVRDYRTVRTELSAYDVDLSKRPEIVALTKTEGLDTDIVEDQKMLLKNVVKRGTKVLVLSAHQGDGLAELLFETARKVDTYTKKTTIKKSQNDLPVIRLANDHNQWTVEAVKNGFVVTGNRIEKFASKTDFENFAGVDRLRDIMRKMGIMHELERKKIKPDQDIIIGKRVEYGRFKY